MSDDTTPVTPETPTEKFDLNKLTWSLLQQEPFFAALSRRIHKSATTAVPTAGVKINKDTGHFEMVYNPAFFEGLTPTEQRAVLKHEMYHLIFQHVTGRLPPEGMSKMWNVATDLAINSFIAEELPEGGCIPGKAPFEEYPAEMSAEWYFSKLQNDEQFQQDSNDGEGDGDPQSGDGEPGDGQGQSGSGLPDSLDDHSGWGDVDQETRALAEERLKDAVRKASEEVNAGGRGWGSVTASCRKKIQDMVKARVNWRSVLRYFIKTSQRANKRSTVRRINKRFPYIHAGKRVSRTAKIAISIDQSGSVSDAMLAAFFVELENLAKYAEFTVVPFDTEVAESEVYVWKKGKRRTWDRVSCGGTDFNAPTRWVNARQFDGHIILTDMEAPKPIPSKCQRMWMSTPECIQRQYFTTNERVIAID
jgi:predicted metal-dependent peptidase